MALLMPDAVPLRPAPTEFITVVVRGATIVAKPGPSTKMPGNTLVQYAPLADVLNKRAYPPAQRHDPTAKGTRGPKREAIVPENLENIEIRILIGRKDAPAIVAE